MTPSESPEQTPEEELVQFLQDHRDKQSQSIAPVSRAQRLVDRLKNVWR